MGMYQSINIIIKHTILLHLYLLYHQNFTKKIY